MKEFALKANQKKKKIKNNLSKKEKKKVTA